MPWRSVKIVEDSKAIGTGLPVIDLVLAVLDVVFRSSETGLKKDLY